MDETAPVFPDIADLLAQKADGRRARARMSFVDKILWVERARRELAPIDRLRRLRADQGRQASFADTPR